MTTRWIAASLAVLALAACHKKDEAKPPPPKPDAPTTATTTPPATPPATPPVAETPATETPPVADAGTTPTPPTPGVTPVTTPDAPATFIPVKPIRVIPRPPIKVEGIKIGTVNPGSVTSGGRPPPVKIAKTKAQQKAEHDILGLWIEQKNRKSVLNFLIGGKVEQRDKITSPPSWTGEWKADPDGAIQFTLSFNNPTNPLRLTAYPTAADIMAVAPHWTKEWGGSGQYAYERMK